MGYEFQDKIFGAWRDNNWKGVVKATPSSGKTIGGLKALERYLMFAPYDRVWIIANSKEVLNQWKQEAKRMNLDEYFEYYTYSGAVSKMNKFDREGKLNQLPDVMILDECHFTNAPVWGQVMNFGIEKYLGLSGTPNHSEKRLGGIILTVDWEDANIADTEVYLVKYKPTESELDKYKKRTAGINSYREACPNSNYKNDPRLSMLYNARRALVYNFKSRLPFALQIIKKNIGKKQMIFCMHHRQAIAIGQMLEKEGISHCIHITGKEDLDRFLKGEVDVCVSCRKLNTGFNFPPADTAVLVSSATSPLTATQTLSRVIRPDPDNPDKKANIYILLAEDTNDMELIKNNIFIKSKMHVVNINDILGI